MKRLISGVIVFSIIISSVLLTFVVAAADFSADTSSVSSDTTNAYQISETELEIDAGDSELPINPLAFVIIGIALILGLVGRYLYRKKKGLIDKNPEEDFFELLKRDKEDKRDSLNISADEDAGEGT